MKKLRIGIIGLGMGQAHVHGYRQHAQAEVVAAADVNEVILNERGKNLQIPSLYTSAAEMLKAEKLDVVSVATPNKFHMPLTVAAFKAGCHVLCEKPLAMNAAEGRKILAASKAARKRLGINFSFRFNDQSWALKKQVDSGILGDVYFAETTWMRRRGMPGFGGWFGTKALAGGGPLIDLGVHRMDLSLWLMGYPRPVWVLANTYDHIARPIAKAQGKTFDVEDMAAAMVKFANGATMMVKASWAGNIAENEKMETRLLGTKGGLVQRNLGEGYAFEAEMYVEREGAQFDMKLHPPMPGAASCYYQFVDAIVNNRPHTATGEEGLIVMELIDAIYASAKQGKPIKIGK